MKFTASITLLTVASLAQGLVVPRDQKAVTDVLSGVQAGIDNLDTAVKSCCGNLGGLLDASNKLIAAITGGTTAVSSSTPLTLIESIKIIKPVQSVEAHAKTLVGDLKGQKANIVKAGLCGVFAQQIETINGDSQQLVKTTVSKVPQIAQSVATKVAQGILDVLADAKDSFSAANCK